MTESHYAVIWFSGGGGQAFYATAGGKDLSGLSAAVEKAKSFVKWKNSQKSEVGRPKHGSLSAKQSKGAFSIAGCPVSV